MHIRDLADIRAALQSARTLARLNDVYRRAMAASGFTAYALGYVPSDEQEAAAAAPFLLLNWPKAWLQTYAREGFAKDDILLAEAARTSEPFTWSEVRSRHPAASARAFALAATFGWTDGLLIPIHNESEAIHERFGVVSLAGPALNDWGHARRAATVAVSLTAFARARSLTNEGRDGTAVATLTDREREALALVAEGLGDADIAAVMKVTTATAHYHVERAKKRLQAATRAQAIAIAITHGLV